ncbi:MAG: antitoxin [Parcubacteria group bacterium CG11_big_fil_rev_8_21_14_0_20_39_22]|nr:MAG: antitoxin [Parcubacteria group bacterium CG11_big_fil_rev_8_21_14_0_20_39_22]
MKKDQKLKLNKEEAQISRDFDRGVFKSVKDFNKEKTRYQMAAKRTLGKMRSINIRVSDRTLHKMKALAAEKGLPYQTLISSVLHQYPDKN